MDARETALAAKNDKELRVPCYCEENVWRLAYRRIHDNSQREEQYHVVFVSNPKKCVPMFQQLASENPNEPCFWDYHVILLQTSDDNKTIVMDIDSHLPCTMTLKEHLEHVFPTSQEWRNEYHPCFRVIEAPHFLETFSSDRSHMYDKERKKWNAPPPSYACIQVEQQNNIMKFATITQQDIDDNVKTENRGFGTVYSLAQLRDRFHVH